MYERKNLNHLLTLLDRLESGKDVPRLTGRGKSYLHLKCPTVRESGTVGGYRDLTLKHRTRKTFGKLLR